MSVTAGAIANAESKTRLGAWRVSLSVAMAAGLVFVIFPDLDLWISRAAYTPMGFVGGRIGWLAVLRGAFIGFYFVCVTLCHVGLANAWAGRARFFSGKQWLFLVVCLGVGPGLLANLAFKDQWGRARPKHVTAFGGEKLFTPALWPTKQCRRNCSFVSGEASSAFMPFYAAAAVVPQWTATLVVVGTAAGLTAGAVRVAQGAHFASDVIFAGLLMGLAAFALSRLMLGATGFPRIVPRRLWQQRNELKRLWRPGRGTGREPSCP